jgi:hypothetical protein
VKRYKRANPLLNRPAQNCWPMSIAEVGGEGQTLRLPLCDIRFLGGEMNEFG